MLWFRFEVEDLILLGLLWAGAQLLSNFLHRTLFGLPAEAVAAEKKQKLLLHPGGTLDNLSRLVLGEPGLRPRELSFSDQP